MRVSTINEDGYYNSDKNDAEGDPKSDPKVVTHTTNRNQPHKIIEQLDHSDQHHDD